MRTCKTPAFAGIAIGSAAAWYFSTQRLLVRSEAQGALDPSKFTPLPVGSITSVSKDTKKVVFQLPEGHTLGGKTAYMVLFKTQDKDGKTIIRPYTPVSDTDSVGLATFVIKKYPGGAMTEYVHSLKEGDSVEVKGPIEKYPLGQNQHKQIALIGGGSGITPLYQVLQKIAQDKNDETKVTLYYASRTPEDILLRKEIDEAVSKKPGQLAVHYFVDKGDWFWRGELGFISKDYLKKHLFKASEDNVKVFVCGPPPLYEAISGNKKSPSDQGELTGALKELGFSKEQVFKF